MRTRLTRQSFLNSIACPRLGWYSRLETPPVQLSPGQGMIAERFLLDEDREVHSRARTLFPDAAMVTRQAYEAACWQTQDLMERTATTVVLEAAFGTGSCKARADSLVRSGEEWHLHEIKAHTGLTTNLVDEVGFVWMVLDLAGVHLGRASVLLVSPAFRAGMPDRDLFTSVDITESAASRAREFAGAVATIDAATRTPEPPAARLIPHCRRCPLFSTCTGAGIAHSLFELPHVTPLQLERMLAQGYRSVADLPAPTLLKRRQSAVWQSVITEQMVLTGDLRGALAAVVWPARYLDFETVGTALPLFPGLAPFEQLPFLYSVRTRETPEAAPSHHGFLAPHDREGSRELAERLLQDLGSDGSAGCQARW